ncbi:hypothetical protein NEOLI_004660 [Neolecta irregularis DAH-3]|uniref:Uncharacterized protein n=1 Tax=Neolecta irregularis (strain DAH-3) TaxID=1198029 RepID=A0A1U7LV17_NEOID|nr:hypothetical protein NEOLI_004660 [Neolecta irregularis DAH-3]|eukprot:OLL26392.1 hypothetical protein NEOLI_004660 [Neolecta irregularis DAH-3]
MEFPLKPSATKAVLFRTLLPLRKLSI